MPHPLKAIVLSPVMALPALPRATAAVLFAQPAAPTWVETQTPSPRLPQRSSCRVLSPPSDGYHVDPINTWPGRKVRGQMHHAAVAPLSPPVVPLGPAAPPHNAPVAPLGPPAEQRVAHAISYLDSAFVERAQHLQQSAYAARDGGPPSDWRALFRSAAQCYVQADGQWPESQGWSWADQAVTCYIEAGDPERACFLLDSLVKRYPLATKTSLRQARALLLRGDTDAGSQLLTDALRHTRDAEFWQGCKDLLDAFDLEIATVEVIDLTCDTCCQSHLG